MGPLRTERDACGIGFVADASGRASREIVTTALGGLACVVHRGALAADARTSDGSGVLVPIPPGIFGEGNGVVSLFVRGGAGAARDIVGQAAGAEGLEVLEWRAPPTDPSALGNMARKTMPRLLQAIIGRRGNGNDGAANEQAAFRLRRRIAATAPSHVQNKTSNGTTSIYVASCSFRTVVYKGLVASPALAHFYLDLADDRFVAPFVVFHQRFSTNTLPTWERAQPFRMLCHNGEINALAGNINRMRARAVLGTEAAGLGPEELFHPVLDPDDSDSGQLDSAVELLVRGGRDIRHAVAMLVPEAWEGARDIDPEVRGFYRYHSCLLEPWDGPAGLILSDGLGVGAALDRNGLRPLRWAECEDGLVVCCSEAGAVDLAAGAEHGWVRRGRLGPGQMLFVDPTRGLLLDQECKQRVAAAAPFARWAADGLRHVNHGKPVLDTPGAVELERRQLAHGYTVEELRMMLKPMTTDGKEPVFSMGDDTPLPPLAGRPRPISHYLRQRFAQVTNPPIDHLRERLVMSLHTIIGPRRPLLEESLAAAELLILDTFFVYPGTVATLLDPEQSPSPWPSVALDATFPVEAGPAGLRAAVERLRDEAAAAVREHGAAILVIDNGGVSAERAPVPSLLAVGTIHHRLIADGDRLGASLVVVADDARDVHWMATLLGYGADLVCPRLALQTVAADADADADSDITSPEAQERFQTAAEDGVLKVMSKMGIATVDSYRGAQIFEIVGLAGEVVDLCFAGTPSALGGLGWEELGADALALHAQAWPGAGARTRQRARGLPNPGYYRDLKRGGEYHAHNQDVIDALQAMTAAHILQKAIASGSDEAYDSFAALVHGRPPTEPRDLLTLVAAGPPVLLEEVEPATSIVQRFSTGAMSHGSISREAHENLARAMNLIGGRSNCGEGGEDPYRFATRGQGRDDKNSNIKQIASGRFGVTPEYCAYADELQIKIAQGSKPGEGGQLPGHKVSDEIARLRHTQAGVTLISPPPHHDIYSIEDLAQLIFDLKQVNGFADVSVKLVACDGVGTVAAGVVKALADVVQISGANGGTGASPLSSIKHAGMPWELGLAETQASLVTNGLRDRVRVRVDGGFLTGRDVVVAALLGADEYSFGSASMIAEGCIMLRACHRDTCSTGIATQRPNLRAKFSGTPEGVAAYFMFVAEEVRRTLAALGFRSMDEAIGRVECLRRTDDSENKADPVHRRAATLDLSSLLTAPPDGNRGGATPMRYVAGVPLQRPRSTLGDRLAADAFRAVWDAEDVELAYRISNSDRAVGAALGGAFALEFGTTPPPGRVRARFDGSAGQSFGAFLTEGIELVLVGEANDYVGKGMSGGHIVIRPPANDASLLASHDPLTGQPPVLAGNTCLYGATGGLLLVAGRAGERFGVRNSGADAVVEGVGDHACEYMTGGTIVILGEVGYNLGAGMTGGLAFVLHAGARLGPRVNPALVEVERPDAEQLEEARWMIELHAEATGSRRAAALLEGWDRAARSLWLVAPKDNVERRSTLRASQVGASA